MFWDHPLLFGLFFFLGGEGWGWWIHNVLGTFTTYDVYMCNTSHFRRVGSFKNTFLDGFDLLVCGSWTLQLAFLKGVKRVLGISVCVFVYHPKKQGHKQTSWKNKVQAPQIWI